MSKISIIRKKHTLTISKQTFPIWNNELKIHLKNKFLTYGISRYNRMKLGFYKIKPRFQ